MNRVDGWSSESTHGNLGISNKGEEINYGVVTMKQSTQRWRQFGHMGVVPCVLKDRN